MSTGLLTLGNQLFELKHLQSLGVKFAFMREDYELCTYFKFHKLKILFFLAAMRTYAQELRDEGYQVTYQELDQSEAPPKKSTKNELKKYESFLVAWIEENQIEKVVFYEIEDKFFEKRILECLSSAKVKVEILPSPMFLTNREQFKTYLQKGKRPFLKTFYEGQRKKLKIMVNEKGEPVGGQWSFDELNRQALPKDVHPPEPRAIEPSLFAKKTKLIQNVQEICERDFADHPGDSKNIWFPVDRKGAHEWLKDFLEKRLLNFGPYEDALTNRSDFVFHSGLTPFLNTGLLTPDEVVKSAIRVANKNSIPLASIEGFIRQVIGWREFVRGIYQNYSEKQDATNFWGHARKLTSHWYDATTGIPPLDQMIDKANRLSYAHHIERLMVAGNLMLLLEIDPRECHRWFMEMFLDSSDWVMGPNVYGMAIFSDGGIFATKPYICGSNYYRKMGGFKKDTWCDAVDGLYWGFVEKHANFFSKNPRLSMMVRTVEKMDSERKRMIYNAAQILREQISHS